jgi:very-short-patch-repair endonuclease
VVEVDGHRYHGSYRAFQRDRAKTNRLIAAGYVVLRFTWAQLTQRPMLVCATIARTMGRLEAQAG